MTARIIDGKALAKRLRGKFRQRVDDLIAEMRLGEGLHIGHEGWDAAALQ